MPGQQRPPSRQERRRQQRRHELERQQRQHRQDTRRWYMIGGIVAVFLVLIGGGAFFVSAQNNNDPNHTPGAAIDGINCEAEMLQYHIHANLTLYQNGRRVVVPAGVGIPYNPAINVQGQNGCLYWLHTHNPDDIIHIESPTKQIYNLGQFFDIWHYTAAWDSGSPLAASVGYSVNSAFPDALRAAKPSQIRVYVGGKYIGHDYKDVPLTYHKLITVELGTPVKPPTTKFDFGSN
jgi:hypothetical protein